MITPTLSRSAREVTDLIPIDRFLFGESFAERCRVVKTVETIGNLLKPNHTIIAASNGFSFFWSRLGGA